MKYFLELNPIDYIKLQDAIMAADNEGYGEFSIVEALRRCKIAIPPNTTEIEIALQED